MTAEPSDAERERVRVRPGGFPVMRQLWRHLGFLHWRVAPEAIAPLLPPGLEVDTFGGAAYVGVVPFTIPRSRLPGIGLPIAPPFHELNVRTYVHRAGRDPGVWFFSLDAASRLAVAGARLLYGLPYFHARMSMRVTGSAANPNVEYASRRRRARGRAPGRAPRETAELAGHYWPTGPAHAAGPRTLEYFLIERYLLYAWNGKFLSAARVFHEPYEVQTAGADITETLTTAAGLPPKTVVVPLAHYVRETDVRIYRPRRVTD